MNGKVLIKKFNTLKVDDELLIFENEFLLCESEDFKNIFTNTEKSVLKYFIYEKKRSDYIKYLSEILNNIIVYTEPLTCEIITYTLVDIDLRILEKIDDARDNTKDDKMRVYYIKK